MGSLSAPFLTPTVAVSYGVHMTTHTDTIGHGHGEFPPAPIDGQHQAKLERAASLVPFHTSECRKGISVARCCGWQSRIGHQLLLD